MAVEINYTKQKTPTVDTTYQAAKVAAMADMVDHCAEAIKVLAAEEAKLDPLRKKIKAMKKDLQEYADSIAAPDETTVLEGFENNVEAGMKANVVENIDNDEALMALGMDTLWELVSLKVGDLRKYCTPPQLEKIFTEARSGARSLKFVQK